jgi:hypothetical protein
VSPSKVIAESKRDPSEQRRKLFARNVETVRREWYKFAVFVSALCLIIFLKYSAADLLYAFHWIDDPKISDFLTYYFTGGGTWLSGSNPYANQAQFAYPPTFLPFFGLFSFLGDINLAAKLWVVSYFSVFTIASVALSFTLSSERRYVYLAVALLLLLISFPLKYLIELSQIDLFVASLTVLSLVCQRIDRKIASAFLLSVATLFKGPAIFLLIYFAIFRRDLKYLLYFAASTIAIVGISLIVVPIKLYSDYFVNVLPTLFSQYELPDSQSVVRLLYLAGLSKPALQIVSVAGIGLFAIFAFTVGSSKSLVLFGESSILDDGVFLMNGLIVLLFSPRSLIYPYVWVILPLALFLSGILVEANPKLLYLGVICLGAFLVNSEPYSPNAPFSLSTLTLIPWITIGNLLLTLSLMPMYVRPLAFFRSKHFMRHK